MNKQTITCYDFYEFANEVGLPEDVIKMIIDRNSGAMEDINKAYECIEVWSEFGGHYRYYFTYSSCISYLLDDYIPDWVADGDIDEIPSDKIEAIKNRCVELAGSAQYITLVLYVPRTSEE